MSILKDKCTHCGPIFNNAIFYQLTILALTLSLQESNVESINVVELFESMDETLVCDHSNESY